MTTPKTISDIVAEFASKFPCVNPACDNNFEDQKWLQTTLTTLIQNKIEEIGRQRFDGAMRDREEAYNRGLEKATQILQNTLK